MINNKKIISVVFVSNKSLKNQNNKNFLRLSSMLRNRFSTTKRSASLFEKSSQDFISNRSFKEQNKFVKSKTFNSHFLNNKNLGLTRTKQMFSLLKISSVFKKGVNSTSVSDTTKTKVNLNGDFFPSKKAFIHYWIFPFVGFAGYIYLNKYNLNLNWRLSNSTITNEILKLKTPNNESNQKSFEESDKIKSSLKLTDGLKKVLPTLHLVNRTSQINKRQENKLEKEFRFFNLPSRSSPQSEFEKKGMEVDILSTQLGAVHQKTNQLLYNTSLKTPNNMLGYSRKQSLTDQIPQKLLPIYKTIKLKTLVFKTKNNENNINKFEVSQQKSNYNLFLEPSYSYINATKLNDETKQKVFLLHSLTNFSLDSASKQINYNKLCLNSELIKQVNQILSMSLRKKSMFSKNDQYMTSKLLLSTPVRNTTNASSFAENKNRAAQETFRFSVLLNSKTETLKNNFHAMFLVKYLLKKTEHKHFVNKNLVLTSMVKSQNKSFIVPSLNKTYQSSFLLDKRNAKSPYWHLFVNTENKFRKSSRQNQEPADEKSRYENCDNNKLNLKMQKFLITLNKIQTRTNLEFINTYKNAFPILSKNSNTMGTTSSIIAEQQQKPIQSTTSNTMSLNNLKWNFYELATLKFFKYFVDPVVKENSNKLYTLDKLKKPDVFETTSSLDYTKLNSILKTFSTKTNSNVVKPKTPNNMSSSINLNTNKICYYQNVLPTCFSLSLNEKLSNTDFFDLKNSILLTRNFKTSFKTTMTDSVIKVKASGIRHQISGLPISSFVGDIVLSLSSRLALGTEKNQNQILKSNNNFLNWENSSQVNQNFMPSNFIMKIFIIFQGQNNKLFIENWDFYSRKRILELDKFNEPIIFTSDLLFKHKDISVLNTSVGLKTENQYQYKNIEQNHLQKHKQSFTLQIKQKRQYKTSYKLYLKNLGLRKTSNNSQEKIFRAYLSNKYNENNSKTTTFLNYFYVQKTLKKLKKHFFSNLLENKSHPLFVIENNSHSKFKKNKSINNLLIQKQNTEFLDLNYPAYQQRYSPTTLLRKLGLLFKYRTEFMNKETSDRVEKHRSIQKKRRRKKQKRFYPRPSWLRFLLYRNFLTSRHYIEKSTFFKKKQLTFGSFHKLNKNTLIYEQLPSVTSLQKQTLKNKNNSPVQKNNKQKHFFERQKLMPFKSLDTASSNSFNYSKGWTNKRFVSKIFRNNKKNQVLQQNCINSMQIFNHPLLYEKNLLNKTSKVLDGTREDSLDSLNKNMFHSQDYYQISNEVMSDFQRLCWKSYWLRSSLTPYIRRIQKSMQTIRKIEAHSFDLNRSLANLNFVPLPGKQNSNHLNWYLNLKNTVQFNSEISPFVDFQNVQNRFEYERILYDRISDIIENVKANLDGSGQSRAKAFKVGRTRKDNLNLRRAFSMSLNQSGSQRKMNKYSEESFFSRFGLFVNNNLSTPTINAFSLQSLMDQSIKPFGDLPTLRNFWALNRTHALAGFAEPKTNTGQPDKVQLKQLTETKTLWSVLKLREQNASNKTKKFFSLVWKKFILMPFTYPGLNNLEKISLQKLEVANKKLNYLGVYLKSNKSILKYWKLNLPVFKSTTKSKAFQFHNKETQLLTSTFLKDTPTNLQSKKQAKRSIQFWWSFSESTTGFHIFQFNNSFILTSPDLNPNKDYLLLLASLGGCTILFHLCSLYSFLQSSQIRSLVKFNILLLYKFSNAYLILVYAIFNCIKNYFKQLSFVLSASKQIKRRNITDTNSLTFTQYSEFNSMLAYSDIQGLNSLNKVPFDQRRVELLLTKNETADKNSSLKRNQIFFYGSFNETNQKPSTVSKHFYLLTNFKTPNSKLSEALKNTNDKEIAVQNPLKNKMISKFLELDAFKVRFFSGKKNRFFFKDKEVSNLFVTVPKFQQFFLLEMCFYSPNLKVKDLRLNKLQQTSSSSIHSSLISLSSGFKNIQSNTEDKLFQVDKNFIYSSPKNLKDFIFYNITNLQKQKLTSRFYSKKDSLVTRKYFVFNFNKSFQHFYSRIWVGLLVMTKGSISLVYNTIGFGSLILFKIIDILESLIMLVYKFLEKPAEFMIEWIAQLFLVEWSSDITTFVPESFDIYTWRSFTKLSRGSRIFSVFGFLMQRRLWCLFEIYLSLLSKPDADLLNRQKKGMIFWDVWAEILITAAEKYRINLSSLTTVKEEQEAFLERLLNDPYWLSSWQTSSVTKDIRIANAKKVSKQTRALAELELLAIVGNRPESWLGRQSFFMKEALSSSRFNFLAPKVLQTLETPKVLQTLETPKVLQTLETPKVLQTLETPKVLQTLETPFYFDKFLSAELFTKYNLNFVNNRLYAPSNKSKGKESFSGVNNLPFFTFKNESLYFASDFSLNWKTWQRWSTNQHFTNQGSDTELFIDVHPPKSFTHLSQLKLSQSGISSGIAGLPTLGSLTCIIYSGLFSKQVSKNILIVGSPGNSQTMLIQALAGETEFKIIADNAYRYAHIQRGIAVGMKLLRDVFDGLALHTPCLFLIEDIHVIGERRPMLISDNENVKAAESSFAAENEEVHEKNMFIYQLSKHAITDYRKPYKGDFSLLIPTNHFCFDLFLGVSPPKIRKNGKTARSPFALETKFYETQKDSNSAEQQSKSTNVILKTLLQKNSEQFFAPPATSPFNILGIKEQRQFKAKQVVKEIPWGGFSNDQMMLLPKMTYSIRVKIALLADLAMNQLSVKLDMITDLLVIMDNVRSNRGFVVFATTHVPFVLDPALRRPGRLDETISLPFAPTLIDRFEILKTSLLSYTTTVDFMSYSFLLQNYTETDLSNFISRTKLLLFNNLNDYSQKLNQSYFSLEKDTDNFNCNFNRKYKFNQTFISSLNTALNFITQLEVTEPKRLSQRVQKAKRKLHKNFQFDNLQVNNSSGSKKEQKSILELLKLSKIRSSILSSPSTLVSITYSQIGKFILGSQILKDNRVFRTIVPSFEESSEDGESTIFRNLYSSSVDIQNTLLYLLSGKAGEFFFFNQLKLLKNSNNNTYSKEILSKNSFSTFSLKPTLANPEFNVGLWNVSTPLSQTNFTKNQAQTLANNQKGGSPQVEELWSSATSFVFALVQKRYLYNKTLLMNRLLYFNDISMLKEPPSPPGSSILITAKKYENLKRTERDFQQRPFYSILEKIMLHQQQRFMKKLYERPVLEVFQSEMVQNRYTSFNSSIKELGYYDSFMRKPSSSQSFYKNRILTRHKFSFINQWWNGQLAEHNLESTFSSDVDWRSMFVETFGDLVIDFPDADQHYNPKSRRWFLQSTYGGYWNSFEKSISFEVYQHYIIFCFNKAVNYLHTEREILDSLAYTYLQKGSFKELDLLANLSRFNTLFKN